MLRLDTDNNFLYDILFLGMVQLRLLDDHKEVSTLHRLKDVSQPYAYGGLIPPTISRILFSGFEC